MVQRDLEIRSLFYLPPEPGVEKKTKQQEKDVSTTTSHNQLPSLVYSIRRPCAEDVLTESTGLRNQTYTAARRSARIKVLGLNALAAAAKHWRPAHG